MVTATLSLYLFISPYTSFSPQLRERETKRETKRGRGEECAHVISVHGMLIPGITSIDCD